MFNAIKSKVLDTVKKINDSYEFKPLLSEIEEAPVSPLGRFTFWTIVSLIIVTSLWLFIGKVDIVVSIKDIYFQLISAMKYGSEVKSMSNSGIFPSTAGGGHAGLPGGAAVHGVVHRRHRSRGA